jgi:hypothetical protein
MGFLNYTFLILLLVDLYKAVLEKLDSQLLRNLADALDRRPRDVGDAAVSEREHDPEGLKVGVGQRNVDVVLEGKVWIVGAENGAEKLGDGGKHDAVSAGSLAAGTVESYVGVRGALLVKGIGQI